MEHLGELTPVTIRYMARRLLTTAEADVLRGKGPRVAGRVHACTRCGRWFAAASPVALYCCDRCASDARRDRRANAGSRPGRDWDGRPVRYFVRDCEHCGRRFQAGRSDARFCEGRCRVAAHRRAVAGAPG